MQCPTEVKLIQLAFGLDPEGEENVLTDHLGYCAACRKAYESARDTAQLLYRTHKYFDADHEVAKAQLLKSLPESVAQRPNKRTALSLITFFQWIGGTTMRSRILALKQAKVECRIVIRVRAAAVGWQVSARGRFEFCVAA